MSHDPASQRDDRKATQWTRAADGKRRTGPWFHGGEALAISMRRTWSEALFCHEADKDINLTNAAKADLARLTSTRSTLLPTHMAHISGGRNKDVEKIATIAPIDHGSGEPGSGSHGFNARRSFSTWRGDREASQSDIVPNYQGCKETQLPTFCRINTK